MVDMTAIERTTVSFHSGGMMDTGRLATKYRISALMLMFLGGIHYAKAQRATGELRSQQGVPNDSAFVPPSPSTILAPEVVPIDLNTALRLAGVQNPQLMIARQRVVEAAALRQLAAAQFLPS